MSDEITIISASEIYVGDPPKREIGSSLEEAAALVREYNPEWDSAEDVAKKIANLLS